MTDNTDYEQRAFNAEIGVRLEIVRMYLGLKKEEMAETLGLAGGTYSQAIRGTSVPPAYRLRKIIEIGFTSDWIYYGVLNGLSDEIRNFISNNSEIARSEIYKSSKPRKKS